MISRKMTQHHLATLTVLLVSLLLSIRAQPDSDSDSDSDSPKPKYHIGYRQVNWCVTGKDEPELHDWPYSQFVPLLRRWNREKLERNIRYDLRFYDIITKQQDVGKNGHLLKTMHVVFKAEKRKDPTTTAHTEWVPMQLEGLIIQANSNPYSLALPTGQFFTPGSLKDPKDEHIHCRDCSSALWARSIFCRKRAKIHVEHPSILAWHYLQPSFNISEADLTSNTGGIDELTNPDDDEADTKHVPPAPFKTDGKQSEIHANFRFFSPRCSRTRRLMFTILAVRSFVFHEYDVFYRGPYEVTSHDQIYRSDIHPSPYFNYYTEQSLCHISSAKDITLEHPQKFRDFEMNHLFDCCIREEENRKTKVTIELLELKDTLSTSCYEKLYKQQTGKFDPRTIRIGDEIPVCFFPFAPKQCWEDSEQETPPAHYEPCPPCKAPATTTTERPTEPSNSIYKRTAHGGLMIMTNFCLQPIVIYIARFYKETFNTKSYKGGKGWYMMHLMGGMVSSGMVYLGYFSGGNDQSYMVRSHVAIGKVYIVTLGVCYCTAWGRHKAKVITWVAELLHGCFGYVTIFFALGSVLSAPGLEYTAKLLVFLMLCTQGFFMIILSCHICLLDKKIGMRPKRRHFPTVEARFDEIAVPGAKFRVIMLFIFSAITFSLSTASTFFD